MRMPLPGTGKTNPQPETAKAETITGGPGEFHSRYRVSEINWNLVESGKWKVKESLRDILKYELIIHIPKINVACSIFFMFINRREATP